MSECKDCKFGCTLRIHVLTGNRNCKVDGINYKGHFPTGECKDYQKK